MKQSIGDRVFNGTNYVFTALFTVFCFIPFWVMVIASITEKRALRVFGYRLWPKAVSLEAYQWVLKGQQIIRAYRVTVFVTVVGTLLSVMLMAGLAYAMSTKRLKLRHHLAFYVYLTMIFSGGIIPWFITCRAVGLYDNIWALIVPMLINPWWVFILRNYFNSLPLEILESAFMDGAGDLRVLTSIVLPLAMPVLATTSLFVAVAYWNDWWHGVILLKFADFRPLQVIILRIINSIRAIREAMQQEGANVMIDMSQIPDLSVRMATVVITIGPVILFYPFAQRYFIRGLMVGSIKG